MCRRPIVHPVASGRGPPRRALKANNEDARRAYRQGHQALSRGQWIPAFESFLELERILRGAKETADVALYWQAYSLSRAGRARQAKGIAERLVDRYPQSRGATTRDASSAPRPRCPPVPTPTRRR